MEDTRVVLGAPGPLAKQLKPTECSQTLNFERAQADGRSMLHQGIHACLVKSRWPFQESDLGFLPASEPRAPVFLPAFGYKPGEVGRFLKAGGSSAGAHLLIRRPRSALNS